MRIAINTRFLLSEGLEGIGRYTYELCRRLVAAHPEHQFLFLFDRPFEERFLFGEQVEGKVVPPPARHPLLWYLWFEWALPPVLEQWRADVFFSPDGYASLRTAVPTLMTIHDLAFEHFSDNIPFLAYHYCRYFTPRYCQRVERIATVSDYTRQDIEQRYGISRKKIRVCGNGCREGFHPLSDTEKEASRQRFGKGKPYFLYIGAIHPRKNVHRLIAAFTDFKERTGSQVQLLLAGRFAWQTGRVKTAYENSPFRQDIHFLGYVPDEDLPVLLGGALCFVYPSLFEGFGLPLLEAMQAEVPIITSNLASMPEVAGPAARLVNPQATNAIAHAMQEIEEKPALRQQLIQEGRQQRGKFSWDEVAAVVDDMLMGLYGAAG